MFVLVLVFACFETSSKEAKIFCRQQYLNSIKLYLNNLLSTLALLFLLDTVYDAALKLDCERVQRGPLLAWFSIKHSVKSQRRTQISVEIKEITPTAEWEFWSLM